MSLKSSRAVSGLLHPQYLMPSTWLVLRNDPFLHQQLQTSSSVGKQSSWIVCLPRRVQNTFPWVSHSLEHLGIFCSCVILFDLLCFGIRRTPLVIDIEEHFKYQDPKVHFGGLQRKMGLKQKVTIQLPFPHLVEGGLYLSAQVIFLKGPWQWSLVPSGRPTKIEL